MKRILGVLSGVFLILASIWGMFYGLHVFPYGTWQSIPAYITAWVMLFIGAGVTFKGLNCK